jgi:hypothetical protein
MEKKDMKKLKKLSRDSKLQKNVVATRHLNATYKGKDKLPKSNYPKTKSVRELLRKMKHQQ